ncbi:MAG: preprotein translocase subunit SecE [Gammaproteobacteria bacterium]|nr:preprotein translocase subunit SecE [Gammaproteobacteria bacterium]
MNLKSDGPQFRFDAVKWLIIFAIVLGGVYANSQYGTVTLLYRALIGVALLGIVIAIALQTAKGHATWELAKEARSEIRLVVWPTRQELTQTTLIVVVVVIFVGFILWGLDSGLSWAVQGIIG